MTQKKIYKLSRHGNLLLVNAAITGNNNVIRKVKLLLDTGSSYTVLRSNLLLSICCEIKQSKSLVTITTGSGVIQVPLVTVPRFYCLGQQIDNFPLVAYTIPATAFVEGLLGMDFLNRFHCVINIKQAEIRFL